MYNAWFLSFAPQTYRDARVRSTALVEAALKATGNLTNVSAPFLRRDPAILATLRMSTCPPLAVDRLIGLAGVSPNLVKAMEQDGRLPPRMTAEEADADLAKIASVVERMADPDVFVWIGRGTPATEAEVHRAATIVADRLSGSMANPSIRNAQERRQLAAIKAWLEARGYKQLPEGGGTKFDAMPPGTFSFRMDVPVKLEGGVRSVKIPIDAVIQPKGAHAGAMPLLFEAKSAGDFTNTNKRRKEEAMKMALLRSNYGAAVRFNLFLCGYFDTPYLGYEAAEGIDWVWEHRIDELSEFGL